jgi:transcriptional regulator with XRE-family HTH domain
MENIGNKIKQIRNLHDLSQDRFGSKIGISGKTISSYETNKATPPLYVLEKISRVYNVSIFDIPDKSREQIVDCIFNLRESIDELTDILSNGLSL